MSIPAIRMDKLRISTALSNELTTSHISIAIGMFHLTASITEGWRIIEELRGRGHFKDEATAFDFLIPFLRMIKNERIIGEIMNFRTKYGAPPLPDAPIVSEKPKNIILPDCTAPGCYNPRNVVWGCGHYLYCKTCARTRGTCPTCGAIGILEMI